VHPSSILSYYPSYAILDEILSYSNYDTLNIYIDLKNNLQTLYMQHAIVNVVESSMKSRYIDTSIFSSIISFLSFHKMYAIRRKNLKINFFIFFETGVSYFHTNLCRKYKLNRKIDDLYGLEKEKRDLFFSIVQKNLQLTESACNKIPDIKVIRLQNLEADFIPHYLITRNLVNTKPNVAHVIYSNDHDMLQSVNDNVYVFQKTMKGMKKIVKKGEIMKSYFKLETPFPDEYFPLAMAIVGDPGDCVDGVKGIGAKRLEEILEDVVKMTNGINNLYDNVIDSKPIFIQNMEKSQNKYINMIVEKEKSENLISRNLKLVGFEILSRFLDNPSTTEIVSKKKYINEILQNSDISEYESLSRALSMNRVYLEEDALLALYYNYNGGYS
jgi:5'-3' exonuclease